MSDPSIEFLKSVPLFSDVSDRGLRAIVGTLTRRTYEAGETVVEEGNSGVGFFIVENGSARVTKDGGETIATLGPGSYFGEVALLAGSSRSATITADSDLGCWAMAGWTFAPMLRNEPTVTLKLLEGLARQQAR